MINPPDQPPDENSKSKRKREVTALQDLGEELLKLNPAQLEQIPLPENVRSAIDEAIKMSAHGALRRQKQFIGKLMRNVDAAPIQAALDAIKEHGHTSVARFRELERWRDRLLAEGDAAISAFVETYPQADRARLRTLARNAQAEQTRDEAPKSARTLFRYLRDLTE
jgi:ribosome-associated protein